MSTRKNKLALYGGISVCKNLLPYGKQFVDQKDIRSAIEVLQSDWLATGPTVLEFKNSLPNRWVRKELLSSVSIDASSHSQDANFFFANLS